MLRPTTGELLRGVRLGLAEHVLPALPDGAAVRQLKASLHILRRIERSWDRLPAYLEADNMDISDTLGGLVAELAERGGGYPELSRRLASPPEPAPLPAGVCDARLARLMAVNGALQSALADFDRVWRADRELDPGARQAVAHRLHALHRRMLERAAVAAGTAHDD